MRAPSDTKITLFVVIFLVGTIFTFCDSKKFTRCQLVKELLIRRFNKTFLSNWVCLIEFESERDTKKITSVSNGSQNYGIFQINTQKWCKDGRGGGACQTKCTDLLSDDITEAARCALKIFELEGFKHWKKWLERCKGRELPDLSVCPEFHASYTYTDRSDYHNRGGYPSQNPIWVGH